MKTILLAFIVLVLSLNLSAQSNSEPLQLSKNFLVHSAGLPEEFLLFVPDSATQILFNPARANNFSSNFVYVNYLSDYINPAYFVTNFNYESPSAVGYDVSPLEKGTSYISPVINQESYSSSRNPTFSVAALFGENNNKWLITITNGINLTESGQRLDRTTQRFSENSFNELIVNKNIYNNSQDQLLTTFKISRIWKGRLNNYSLGLFGIFHESNSNRERTDYTTSYRTSTIQDQRRFSKGSGTGKDEIKNNRFALGLEFSINDKIYDYIGSLSYQKNNAPKKAANQTEITEYDSNFTAPQWNIFQNNRTENMFGNIKSNPSIFAFSNYLQHSFNWITPVDNIYFTLNTFYSTDEKSYDGLYKRSQRSFSNGNSGGDSASYSQSGKTSDKSWGINLSAGYAISFSSSDLYFLSGFQLSGSYKNIEDLGGSVSSNTIPGFYETNDKVSFAAITLPLYINYSPSHWISIFGGLNYTFYYFNDKYEYDSNKIEQSFATSTTYDRSSINSSSYLSQKSIYAGCELRHDSGMKIQFFFDETFTNIRDWNVSVGYHF